MSVSAQNGKIAEVLVELELLKRGWHVERLDGSSKAANGDLIAIRGRLRPIIQIKSGLSWKRPTFGHATSFLQNGSPFFNAKEAPIHADFLVTVVSDPNNPLFHVFPIEDAERIAREIALRSIETPKKDGTKRSINFPVSVSLADQILKPFHNNWTALGEYASSVGYP